MQDKVKEFHKKNGYPIDLELYYSIGDDNVYDRIDQVAKQLHQLAGSLKKEAVYCQEKNCDQWLVNPLYNLSSDIFPQAGYLPPVLHCRGSC